MEPVVVPKFVKIINVSHLVFQIAVLTSVGLMDVVDLVGLVEVCFPFSC